MGIKWNGRGNATIMLTKTKSPASNEATLSTKLDTPTKLRKGVRPEGNKDFPVINYFIGTQAPEKAPQKPDWRSWKNDEFTAAWIGHSTVLINFFGTWILTDPVFSERCGPKPLGLLTFGPRRLVEPALKINDMPRIDLLLISHAHLDHTDMPSLKKFTNAKHVVVAQNTGDIYTSLRFEDLQELDWEDDATYQDLDDLRVEAIEVKHFGWRFPWEPCRGRNEKNGRSFNAYLVEKRDAAGKMRRFVFGGDTAYTKSFAKIGERMRLFDEKIDLAIMPIGTYNPWIGGHCNPEQSWQMTNEMNAEAILPIHWNTFTQSSEPRFEPIEWLQNSADDPARIALKEIGATWNKA